MWSTKRWERELKSQKARRAREKAKQSAERSQRSADISLAVDLPMRGETNQQFGNRKAWARKLGPIKDRNLKRAIYMRRYMALRRKALREALARGSQSD